MLRPGERQNERRRRQAWWPDLPYCWPAGLLACWPAGLRELRPPLERGQYRRRPPVTAEFRRPGLLPSTCGYPDQRPLTIGFDSTPNQAADAGVARSLLRNRVRPSRSGEHSHLRPLRLGSHTARWRELAPSTPAPQLPEASEPRSGADYRRGRVSRQRIPREHSNSPRFPLVGPTGNHDELDSRAPDHRGLIGVVRSDSTSYHAVSPASSIARRTTAHDLTLAWQSWPPRRTSHTSGAFCAGHFWRGAA